MYTLYREDDPTVGDSGQMSMLLRRDDAGTVQYIRDSRPEVGASIRVGSLHARTYSEQDYWNTSLIQEILEDTENMVRFRTLNSVYIWKKG